MSGWGTSGNANRIKDTYIKGFLDISGGTLIVQKSSSLQIMANDSNNPRVEFKPGSVFTVNPGGFDVSYTALATLGFLGVSFENSTIDINSRLKYITTSKTGISPNEIFSTNVGNSTTNSNLGVYGDINGYQRMFLTGDASFNGKLYVQNPVFFGSDLSLNGKLVSGGNALFISDVSINGNLVIGTGSRSVAINKDISAGYALDVSGLAIFRNTMYIASDLSLNANLFVNRDSSLNGNLIVGGDLSLNSNLYVVKRALFSSDVSINGNVKLGSGSRSVAINKDISAGYALDVSGLAIFRNTMYIASDLSLGANLFVNTDSSLNGKVSVGGDLSLNSNLYVVKRALFSSDVSVNGNMVIGTGSRSVAINKDISAGYALDVSGLVILRNTMYIASDLSLNANLFVNRDSSFNGNLLVGGDLSLNSNLYVVKRALFSSDVSINGNVKLGSGSRSVAINKDISAGYALDVSGLVILRNTMYVTSDLSLGANLFVNTDSSFNGKVSVGGDLSLNSNLYVVKRALFSSDVSINGNVKLGSSSRSVAINKDISSSFALDVSGATMIRNTLYTSSIDTDISSGQIYLYDSLRHGTGNIFINNNSSSSASTRIGGGSIFVAGSGITYIQGGATQPLQIGSNITAGGTVNLGTADSKLLVFGDASFNGNVKLGSGSRSVAINKDISAGYALDVSGLAIFRNTMYVASDVSINGNLFVIKDSSFGGNLLVGGDLSLNSNLYVVKRALFSSDVSMLGNLDIGSGSSCLAINKDISAGYALDVSGLAIFRNTMYVTSDLSLGANLFVNTDSSFNGKVSVGGDLSLNSNLYVVKRALFSSDVSINGNVKLGSGSRTVAINKDISAGYALDVSGLAIFRNTMYVASDLSVNAKLFVNTDSSFNGKVSVGGDLSLNSNLYVVKRALFSSDVSINGNVKLGSGSRSVAINKDISAGFALDVSGLVILRNTMYVASDLSLNANLFVNRDSSFNGNLSIGGDLSLNSNLYVVKRSVFTLDVSMLGNLDIGTGSNSVAINKDISSSFALDVSGATKFRGAMDVAGVFTVNGAPVTGSGGGSLTGNVQVGSNSGFVTIDKPYFFADPSLTIYYNFDTSINAGSGVQNIAKPGTYDGSFNVTAGSTTGMIDTTVFNNGKQNNTSLASFRNDPTINNFGIRIGTGTIPVSSTMTFSFWLYKKSRPAFSGGDWDRVFHFTDSTSQFANENNTIALDISSGGNIFPVITKGGGTPVSLITPSLPIVSYDLCTSVWNHVVWTINGTKSIIYINGSNAQTDTLSENITFSTPTQRNNGTIAYSYTTATLATCDFSGNIDDFRYYSDKALSYSEIYQLYNNNFYTFDICGGFLANGSSVIYEPVGSVATANRGTLTLLHGDASGSSSIMFKSVNDPLEYAYIEYDENGTGSTGYHFGLLTIGIENDAGAGAYTAQADRISLFPSGGTGFVGVNTKTPQTALDVSGQMRIYEGAGTTATATGGSLTLEHANTGGTSSLVFKASNSSTTTDYAYVQYEDSNNIVQSLLKYDLSFNIPTQLTHATTAITVPSTGTGGNALQFFPIDNSFVWLNTATYTTVVPINGVTPAYCLSFNQTNLLTSLPTYNVPRINYLNHTGIPDTTSFTISAWIRPTGLTYIQNAYGRYCVFHTVWSATSLTVVVQMYLEISASTSTINAGKLFVLINSDGTNYQFTSIPLTQDTWWHVAFVYNSNTLNGQLYLNGSTTNINTELTGYTGKTVKHSSVFWGHMYNASSSPTDKGFRGQMAFINLFDLPLTASDVKYLYDNPSYRPSISDRGLMTIGVESENGYINNDRIVLWPGAGQGFVGINTKTPEYTLDVSGQIQAFSYNATSDYRTKDNVITLDTTFTVDGLNPVTYQFKPTGKQDVGFLAHEVQELYPFLVNGVKDGPNNQSLNYNGFIGILTKEIKDLKKKVFCMEAKALEQSAKALEQEARIQTLENFILNK